MGPAAVESDSEDASAGSRVLDQAERDGRGNVNYRKELQTDIRNSRRGAIITSKRPVVGNLGRGARITRRPGEPNWGTRPLQSFLAEAKPRRTGERGRDLRLAFIAGSLEDSRKVSTSSRRNRLIRPIE